MAYSTGYLANNNPASNLVINIIEPVMLSVGWVKNTANFTANGLVWNVYESPGANNQIGQNWYLALGWTTEAANGNLQITMFESWNVGGSNLASNYVPNTSPTPLANGVANANPSALPNVVGSNIGWMAVGGVMSTVGPSTVPTSPFQSANLQYWHSITIDRVILAGCNTAASTNGYAFYAGTYDTAWSNTSFGVYDTMPITLINLQIIYSNYSALPLTANNGYNMPALFTREIGQMRTGYTNFTGGLYTTQNSWGKSSSGTDIYSGQYSISKFLLNGAAASAAQALSIRGTLKDLYSVPAPLSSTVYRGDTITFVLNGQTVNANVLFGQATAGIAGLIASQATCPAVDNSK